MIPKQFADRNVVLSDDNLRTGHTAVGAPAPRL
jgi:hypothetical protein